MNQDEQALKGLLDEFIQQSQDHMGAAKVLLKALQDGKMDSLVPSPFHLEIILEKLIELLDTRLGPAVQAMPPKVQPDTTQTPKPKITDTPASSLPPVQKHADDQLDTARHEHARHEHARHETAQQLAKPIIEDSSESQSPASEPPSKPTPTAPESTPSTTPQTPDAVDDDAHEEDHTGGARRTIQRYNHRLEIHYSVPGRDKKPHKAFSRDIGAMGLFIIATRHEKVGQPINLEIELPNHGHVKMRGVVIWTKWVPPALRATDYPGFAVKINSAPEEWFAYFMEVEDAAHPEHE